MNIQKTLLALAVSTVASAAFADVTVTISGSTAFRNSVYDRVANTGTGAILSGIQTVNDSAGSSGFRTYVGTMTGVSGHVTIQFGFTGSLEGMDALNNGQNVTVLNTVAYSSGQTTTATRNTSGAQPTAIFSDVFPSTAGRSSAKFVPDIQVGVVPYVFIKSDITAGNGNVAANISNLTQRQASLLYSSGGVLALGFLTGNAGDTDPVYLVGRYSLSGTRATVESVIYNSSLFSNYYWDTRVSTLGAHAFGDDVAYETANAPTSPVLQAGGVPSYTLDSGGTVSGWVSGGDLGNNVSVFPNAIGYVGIADKKTHNVALTYEGVTESQANVANGSYSLWSYEHFIYKTPAQGGPTGDALTVITAIKNALQDNTFQTTGQYNTAGFVPQNSMTVNRTVDGGPIIPN